ncbi:MAG TPA: adenylate/guanylate cyclase domain-containing protein [Casimicrobiaceae bacterium]|nr:adenylate/guanylate cyclase domain-containing protein [Casimicrobiaceae bacterium]
MRAHLDRGAPWDACDAFREAIRERPDDADLLYLGALAHARAGATRIAHALLDRAQAAPHPEPLLAEIHSLRGRLLKDAYHRAPDNDDAVRLLTAAREQYQNAYRYASDPFPGVNAATLTLLLGDREAATDIARHVQAIVARRGVGSAWDLATDAEARLLQGDVDAAARGYAAAYALAGDNAGIVATMRRQVRLLTRAIPEARALLPLLRVPDVVAFAGHMIDAPGREAPRFPAALAPAVRAAIDRHLGEFERPIVFSSAACGSDLLFIEAALARNAEVNVVLPFDRDDFIGTSVAVGGGEWVQRFDAALGRVNRIIMATEENHLGDDALFEHAAELVEGLSRLRAAQLETTPSMLCVLDPPSDGGVGGTHSAHARWSRLLGPPVVIDLRVLREGVPASVRPRADADDGAAGRENAVDRFATERPPRSWKSMMFADFAGFSQVHDTFAPLFHQRFLAMAAAQIGDASVKPLDAKTWGDGLYIVFASPADAAEFALGFLERTLKIDWTAAGLPATSRIRIALHAGPVFRGFDPVMDREHFFGASVTRAARIEPVTQPGTVYASEAFAATLAASGQPGFALEYVGRLPLAKSYGESTIYRLDRA